MRLVNDRIGTTLLRHECELVRTAYAILRRRRRRHDQFNVATFRRAAWDMLPEIYVRDISGSSSTDAQLQLASATRCDRPLNGGIKFG